MQIEQPAWPLVREHEHLSTARKNDYHGGSCIVISAPARQFHVDHDDALKDIGPNERLCFVLAQTPDISKFVFEQVEGRILLNSLLPNTLGMNAINGKVFFELAFHAESRGVILYNRSQYSQKIHPFSSTPYVLAKEKFSVLPPGTYELLTRNFQIRMKVLNADECNTLNEAVQAGDKRKRYIDGDDRASSPQARADGPSKYRKVSLPHCLTKSVMLNMKRMAVAPLWTLLCLISGLSSQILHRKPVLPCLPILSS